MTRRRRGQRGFTLIELMVAMVVSSLLVGMILAIFLRMSLAYRGEQQVAGLQQVLSSARRLIETDAKQAGLQMTTGVKIATDSTVRLMPVHVVNDPLGPDQVRFLYADTSVQAAVMENGAVGASRIVDDVASFTANDLVVIATPTGTDPNPEDPTGAPIVKYASCIVRVTGKNPGLNTLQLDTAPPYGNATNNHCVATVTNLTMIYKLVARAYRIDPARPDDGVLQMSPTGDLYAGLILDDWQDMAYGFTDLQVATQFYEVGDIIDTPDPDTDPKRDWYSGEAQELFTANIADAAIPPEQPVPLQMSISLVVRTDKDVEGIASAKTPRLLVVGNIDNNQIGDRDEIDVSAATEQRIYRYLTFTVDFRNTGTGR